MAGVRVIHVAEWGFDRIDIIGGSFILFWKNIDMESPSKSKVEVIKQAIKQVIEEGGHYDDRLLSKLMSQLESEHEPNPVLSNSGSSEEDEKERILKELKKVRRQNVITHCLLSVMILLTVTWQISEVSIILKLKNGVTHPFRSIGSMFVSMIKPRRPQDDNDNDSLITEASNLIESTPVHDLKLPMLPKIDLGFNGQD